MVLLHLRGFFIYKMKLIPLTQGQFAKVDDEDYKRVSRHKWSARQDLKSKCWYAITSIKSESGKYKTVLMHRLIMNETNPKIKIDHIKHDGLDNQKNNLRSCTHSQNLCNRSRIKSNRKYIGVYLRGKKWRAKVKHEGREIWLGSYDTEIEAAKARDIGAKKYYGEFASLNFPAVAEAQ